MYWKIKLRELFGGEGSGNFGHAGRPGEVGGSGAGGSLAQEAKQYKSSDEFIAAQQKILHGTDVNYEGLPNTSYAKTGMGKVADYTTSEKAAQWYGKNIKEGFIPKSAKLFDMDIKYSKIEAKEIAQRLGYSQDIRNLYGDKIKFPIYGTSLFDSFRGQEHAGNSEMSGSEGYDAVYSRLAKSGYIGTKGTELHGGSSGYSLYAIFDNSAVKTKQQLIDVWNKANK